MSLRFWVNIKLLHGHFHDFCTSTLGLEKYVVSDRSRKVDPAEVNLRADILF